MKIRLPLFIITLIIFFAVNAGQAQDPIFSQFYASPMQTNPALTGVYNGQFRFIANYKQQWNSILQNKPFRTISAGFDMRSPVGRYDFISYGITALTDEAGEGGFQRNTADLSLSYMKQLGGGGYRSADQYLIAGARAGVGQFNLDPDNLWFTTQFDLDTESIDQSIASGEFINESSDVFIDMAAGLMWYSVFDDNQSLYVGGAVFHANAPKYSFIDANGEETIDMRWMAQFGGEFPLSDELSVLPAVIATGQGENLLSIVGANFRYNNHDWREVAIRAGAWMHLVKDVENPISVPTYTVSAILEMGRLNVGVSYDIAANQLSTATNNRGGFELSLIYVQPATRKVKTVCPKL